MDTFSTERIAQFILYMVALIFSLSLHEAGHAWMSNRFGDDLAKSQGRVSLSPLTHVDPVGTLLFPAISFFTGAPLLGWARPTPVNPLRWREKRKANIWVSAAGVIGNGILATCAAVVIRVLIELHQVAFVHWDYGIYLIPRGDSILVDGAVKLLSAFFTLNVSLAVFNLIPIPPLDGSKILGSLLPDSMQSLVDALDQFGFILLFILVFTGALSVVFRVIMPLASSLVTIGL